MSWVDVTKTSWNSWECRGNENQTEEKAVLIGEFIQQRNTLR